MDSYHGDIISGHPFRVMKNLGRVRVRWREVIVSLVTAWRMRRESSARFRRAKKEIGDLRSSIESEKDDAK